MAVPPTAGVIRQRLHDAISVLRCERNLRCEGLRGRDGQGTRYKTDLARDEHALVYLDVRWGCQRRVLQRAGKRLNGLTTIACEYGPIFAGAQ